MADGQLKLVHFGDWCHECKHWEKDENEDPCFDCLLVEARPNSHKPENFEEK